MAIQVINYNKYLFSIVNQLNHNKEQAEQNCEELYDELLQNCIVDEENWPLMEMIYFHMDGGRAKDIDTAINVINIENKRQEQLNNMQEQLYYARNLREQAQSAMNEARQMRSAAIDEEHATFLQMLNK